MRTTGIILISITILLIGIGKITEMKLTKAEIKDTIYMLNCLKNIITNESCVLAEAFSKILTESDMEKFYLSKGLAENMNKNLSFEESLEKVFRKNESRLSKLDKAELLKLSFTLGKYDEITQEQTILNTISYFKDKLYNMEIKDKEETPIIRTLAFCFSAVIFIILI